MICDDIKDDLELYALGLLDADEHQRVASHLASECPACRAALARALRLNAAIARSAPAVEPPPQMRAKVAGALRGEPRKQASWPWAWLAATAGLAAIAVMLGVGLERERRSAADLRRQLESAAASQTEIEHALALLSDPRTRIAVAGVEARGSYYVSPSRGVVFIGAGMSAPDAGRAYQMWIIPIKGAPQPAGVFRTVSNGTAVHLFRTQVDPAAVAALALTVEPEGGSAAPTTTPMLVAKVGG